MTRIQRQRTKGWRMPEGAVYVGRPSRWGSPFVVCAERTAARAVEQYRQWVRTVIWTSGELRLWLKPLRGRDLVCWCPPDQPCHADVLLELAS